MSIAYVSGRGMAVATRAALLLALSLGGCATSSVGTSSLMDAHAEVLPSTSASTAKTSAAKVSAYPAVEDLPRSNRQTMSLDERSKLTKELIAARDRQMARKAEADAATADKPADVQPAQQ